MSPNFVRDRGGAASAEPGGVARYAIEAAVWGPSVHNTQPWWFGTRTSGSGMSAGTTISLHADVDRRLNVADPDGREMLISCGAALCTLRLAVLHTGHVPEVTLLPDPDRPGLLADVHIGPDVPVTEDVRSLYGEIRRRRSHRGPFLDAPVGASILSSLCEEAHREGATLQIAVDGRTRAALAALTQAGEQVQRLNPDYVSEAARWAPGPGSSRQDGVHEMAYPSATVRTEPYFPTRDFTRGHDRGTADSGSGSSVTGVVAVLTTDGDGREDWLAAGQALQRVLLRASAADLSAAFHTQALEVPELREFIRTRFFDGAHPQIVVRLGSAEGGLDTVRRPTDDMTNEEP
jgi:hypothetical protein